MDKPDAAETEREADGRALSGRRRDMDTVWVIILILLLLTLGGVGYLWARSERAAGETRRTLHAVQQDAQLKGKQVKELKRTVENLSARVYLHEFATDSVYKLLAKGQLAWLGGMRAYGVVQLDTGAIRPFLIEDSLGQLAVDDCFSVVRGQVVKLDSSAFKIVAAGQRETPSPAPSVPDPEPAPPPTREVAEHVDPESRERLEAAARSPHDSTVMFLPEKDLVRLDPNAGLPYFRILKGNDQGTVFPLPFGTSTIGRERSNAIPLKDKGSSRLHCEVTYMGHRFLLRDRDSTNGTFCNGQKVKEHWLEFGDRVRIAETEMVFSCEGYDLKDENPARAIDAFDACLKHEPEFLNGLKNLALLLEHDQARRGEAASVRSKIQALERSG